MAIFSSRDPLGTGLQAAPRRLPVISEEDQRRTFAAKQLAASNAASVGSRLPAAGAPAPVASNYVPPVAAPAAPASSPTPAPVGRLPISFSDAGFASQAEYDAARAGPQTPLAGAAALAPGQVSFGGDSVFGTGGLRLPVSASQQAAQANADAAAQASRLPAGVMPVASPQGWMPGANRTFTPGAKPGRGVMTKTTPEADAFVAKYGASGIPTPASQAADYAKARADNIAAAKKLPDSDPNSFSSKRAAFNQANADQHMDAEGNIVKTTKAQKDHLTTLDEADTAARAAQAKADAMKAKAVSKLAADENKAEKERQKAAEEAAKNTPAAVSERLSQIIPPAPTAVAQQIEPTNRLPNAAVTTAVQTGIASVPGLMAGYLPSALANNVTAETAANIAPRLFTSSAGLQTASKAIQGLLTANPTGVTASPATLRNAVIQEAAESGAGRVLTNTLLRGLGVAGAVYEGNKMIGRLNSDPYTGSLTATDAIGIAATQKDESPEERKAADAQARYTASIRAFNNVTDPKDKARIKPVVDKNAKAFKDAWGELRKSRLPETD